MLIGGSLLYNIVMVFAIHWYESAMGWTYLKQFFKTALTEVSLIYNVVLASGVKQCESVIHIHISTLFLDYFPI